MIKLIISRENPIFPNVRANTPTGERTSDSLENRFFKVTSAVSFS